MEYPKLIGEDDKFIYFLMPYKDCYLRVKRNKETKELIFHLDDILLMIGVTKRPEEYIRLDKVAAKLFGREEGDLQKMVREMGCFDRWDNEFFRKENGIIELYEEIGGIRYKCYFNEKTRETTVLKEDICKNYGMDSWTQFLQSPESEFIKIILQLKGLDYQLTPVADDYPYLIINDSLV